MSEVYGTGEWWPNANSDIVNTISGITKMGRENNVRTSFTWVKGHSGIRGNVLADEAARMSAGLQTIGYVDGEHHLWENRK